MTATKLEARTLAEATAGLGQHRIVEQRGIGGGETTATNGPAESRSRPLDAIEVQPIG